jgi:hypothetical protein
MNVLAHLVTFRTYGTWVTGDGRGSLQHATGVRPPRNMPAIVGLAAAMEARMRQPAVVFGPDERGCVERAMIAECDFRGWTNHALAVRTNHVHVVISAAVAPGRILVALKAHATLRLRERGLAAPDGKVWSRGGDVRVLSSPFALARATEYVAHGQGPALPGSVLVGGRMAGR